jgi:hypothetical protein
MQSWVRENMAKEKYLIILAAAAGVVLFLIGAYSIGF